MNISTRQARQRDIYHFTNISKWRRKGGDRRKQAVAAPGTPAEERRHTGDRRNEWLRLLAGVVYPRALDEGY